MLSVSPAAAALAFALCALACFRIAALLAMETGPWRLAERWREWVLARRLRAVDPDNSWAGGMTEEDLAAADWIAEGVRCAWCVGFWAALPLAALWGGLTGASPVLVLIAWPAMAGVVILLDR